MIAYWSLVNGVTLPPSFCLIGIFTTFASSENFVLEFRCPAVLNVHTVHTVAEAYIVCTGCDACRLFRGKEYLEAGCPAVRACAGMAIRRMLLSPVVVFACE